MRPTWFRIISAFVLIVVVTMFSGLASTIDASQTAMVETTNYNHCNPENPHECPIPCETQVCPLCICIVAEVVLLLEIKTSFQITEINYPDIFNAIPDPFVDEIFHPPTLFISVS